MASFDIDITDSGSAAVKSITDSLGGFIKQVGGGSEALQGLQAEFAEMAAALGPIGVAIQVAAVALAAFAVAAFDAIKATVGIVQQREALRSTFDALGTGANAGEKTLAMLDKLSQTLPFTTDQLAKMARGLMAAGIQGEALDRGVKAIAAATAIMGESGGAAAEKLIKKLSEAAAIGGKVKIDKGFLKQLAAAGLNANDLAAALGVPVEKLSTMTVSAKALGDAMEKALLKKGKGPLDELGLTWDSISAKIKEGVESMFEGLGPDVKALMTEVKSLFSEFFRGSTLAKAGGSVVKEVMHTLLAVATKVVNGIHLGLLKMYIAWLKVKLAVQPATSAIGKLLPAGTGITVLTYIVKGLAVVFGLLAVAVFISLLPLLALVAAIVLVGVAIYAIGALIVKAIGWLAGLASGAVEAGESFINGLVNSISSGVGAVVGAVKNLAKQAVGALKSFLGIASDSKVTTKFGGHFTGGFQHALERGSGDVAEAAKGTGRAAVDGVQDGAGASGGGGGRGAPAQGGGREMNVTFAPGAIVVHAKSEDARGITEEIVAAVFERLALREGLMT